MRINVPDGTYHVTSRGLERRSIVSDDLDRQQWTDLLGRVASRRNWRLYAWALLNNHYHLFLRVPHADLSQGMHDLNSAYVSVYNRRHQRCGPLLQGRFKGILVQNRYHFWELTRYVHLNPVRAGLVGVPDEYPWSSCAVYFRLHMAPPWLNWEEILLEYSDSVDLAQKAYRAFLEERPDTDAPSPLSGATASTLLGSPKYVAVIKGLLQGRLPNRQVPAANQLRTSYEVEEIVQSVCRAFDVDRSTLFLRGSRKNRPRSIALYLCCSMSRSSAKELGRFFGNISGQAVSKVSTRVHQERKRDPQLDQAIRVVEGLLQGC
ncbi:MAG: transposase [Deltaproteobacteria bacterium]|nr:transposase [Deltaproteobacteria bacterium]